ncbi:hypothetical protein [Streptomyces lydicus]|uniref:hypothetical protein n=1 Tax=Streptomyces lydicus TaxID=47763 RepID=UPI00342ED6A3
MTITSAEQISMNPVFAGLKVTLSAASVRMPGGIGVSSSSMRPVRACFWWADFAMRLSQRGFGQTLPVFRRSDEGGFCVTPR